MKEESWEQSIEKLLAELDIGIEGMNTLLCRLSEWVTHKEKDKQADEQQQRRGSINFLSMRRIRVMMRQRRPRNWQYEGLSQLQEVYRAYEVLATQESKNSQLQSVVDKSSPTSYSGKTEKQKLVTQLRMIENLEKGFMNKYNESLDNAKAVEKQEEHKRKQLIEELQQRIKVVQQQYEDAGKVKIEKIRENEMLKHELSKLQPQIMTTESLFDAQLKKKQIEIEIQMTTMKQKIEMMNNFKNVGAETKEKVDKANIINEKIQVRQQILAKKEEEHKMLLTKAHLVMEDYKASVIKINDILRKKDKEVNESGEKLQKSVEAIKDIEAKLIQVDKQEESQKEAINVLLSLEEKLKEELAQ